MALVLSAHKRLRSYPRRLAFQRCAGSLLVLAAGLQGCSGSLDANLGPGELSPSSSTPTGMSAGSPGVSPSGTLVGSSATPPTSGAPATSGATPTMTAAASVAPTSEPTPVTFAPAAGAYRRLTNTAFTNSLRDLLGGPVNVGTLEPDSWVVGGLPTLGAAVVSISELGVERYQTAVEGAVDTAFADAQRRNAILGCQPQSTSDMACFTSFVESFGRRAFRQPLSETLVTRYVKLTSDVATELGDALEGMKAATTAFLLSPNFLYRLERGEPDETVNYWRFTSHEMAARLSYFLTNSIPDAELLDEADAGGLKTADAVRAQAERLLSTPAGRESVGNFARELYQLQLVTARAKDPTMYPEYTPTLQEAMMREVPEMFASVVFDQNASALELFTTRKTLATKELAALYGVNANAASDDALVPITVPQERAGLLGTAAFLVIYGSQKEGSPTLRGKFIRQALLCQTIPAPPADVSTQFEDPPPGVVYTKREKLTMHQEDPNCAGCHALMDPLGLTLENFDAIGRYRTTDNGRDIDVTGNLDGTEFSGALELGQLLGSKPETAKCMLRNLYRYGTGHVEMPEESAILVSLNERFEAGGYKLRDLMLDIVVSDGFRYVAAPTP